MGAPAIPVKTRLERFFRKHKVRASALESRGLSRAQLLRYRKGAASPTVQTARRLIKALNAMGHRCKANDLFALDDDDAF